VHYHLIFLVLKNPLTTRNSIHITHQGTKMPLSRKEIKNRAYTFAKEWQGETRENAEAKPFWEDFFQVFGITRKRVASFEEPVKKLGTKTGFIDLLWKGKLLVEHKSHGKNLDKAYKQGLDYFVGLKEEELPRYVMVSDFEQFKLYDLESGTQHNFTLDQLPDYVHLFDFIAGYEDISSTIEEIDLNYKAAELLGSLHDTLLDSGYDGHKLEILLVRILFCLFAEDTGIFTRHQFINYLLNYTKEDGSDTEMHLAKMFQVLDTPENQRNKNLSEDLDAFPYVNGHLFAERIDMPSFDVTLRDELIECAYFDWAAISPAIFGSLFQSVMNKESRRKLGAHYTSERDILRLIKPLFLDELQAELQRVARLKSKRPQQLGNLQQRISNLQFLDPACGCGNFLIITYRELRRLELAILEEQQKDKGNSGSLLAIEPLIRLECFHGIEIEEWPARIAEVAMWLTQHQMNREFAKRFGHEPDLLPLKSAVHIAHGNALQLDWTDVVKPEQLDYIIGNPPFVGKKEQSKEQKADLLPLLKPIKRSGVLDYVTGWYIKAVEYIQKKPSIQSAFVSTNSICQGEQASVLWEYLFKQGLNINFAHRTFAWESEAKGKAAVHVVIVGFSINNKSIKKLFLYESIKSPPNELTVNHINHYLVDAENIFIEKRTKPISQAPIINKGSEATDFGFLIMNSHEKNELLSKHVEAEKWIKPFIGGAELLKNVERYCLWLVGAEPNEIRKIPEIMERIEKTRIARLNSDKIRTREWAKYPSLFSENRQPNKNYLAIPKVSSERREYLPIGFIKENWIANGSLLVLPNATKYHFGILQSSIHNVWMRTVAGRMKSDYQYSASIVYNNYPWPEVDTQKKQAIEKAAQAVLDARSAYPDSTLADLYDPLTMPANLRKAHNTLDKLVEKAYHKSAFKDDAERIKFLFERYQTLIEAAQ